MSSDDLYFKLIYPGRATESLEAAGERAMTVGRAREVDDATRLVDRWLRADPETMGEPYRVHRSRELTEYIGFVGPLMVRYNIRHASQEVYIVYPIRLARWAGY